MKLIDKAAVVADIERIEYETNYEPFTDEVLGKRDVCRKIREFLDTLEVKEVNLEEEICSFFSKNPIPYEHITDWPLLKNCAIHFFELGLKAQKGE